MNAEKKERIAFGVETGRILQILQAEIYDSPKAFLRENVQNAYDAVLMRATMEGTPISERSIEVRLEGRTLTVSDDGIGMTEDVLRNNFWKAGSSGKKSDLAQRSGVIGTFGIGAMANFGVCVALQVETRHVGSDTTLISAARRDELRIAEDCIDLERAKNDRPPGTTITATLDPEFVIDEKAVIDYLTPFVRFLPVAVTVNTALLSQTSFEDTLGERAEGFQGQNRRHIERTGLAGTLETRINSAGRLLVRLTDITLNGQPLTGELFLLQDGGPIQGFRNLFGLAPVPVSTAYDLGGFVNLNILHPTAGREALNRESIQHVSAMTGMIEAEATQDIAETRAADQNLSFQQYIATHNLTALAKNVRVTVLPADTDVALGALPDWEPARPKRFYDGRDASIVKRFATQQANLVQVSQASPRRKLQLRYLQSILRIEQVPDHVQVERIPATALAFDEAMFVVRVRGVLLEDYLMPDIDLALATISHGVNFSVEKSNTALRISIARDMPAVRMVLETYNTDKRSLDTFVKDFVREHLYPHIRDHVPSSTRQGRDALYKRLIENKELFRYEESEFGEVEALLAEHMAGHAGLEQVLRASANRNPSQRLHVSKNQVGSVEVEIPDLVADTPASPTRSQFEAAPPILRPDMVTAMKVLTAAAPYEKLNHFRMFLALSDRTVRTEGEFFRWPHTTKMIWGSHRIIYIFTDATASLSLYYDIELKEPLQTTMTGGDMLPTTTIITKDRIYVPVPKDLEPAFQITAGAKEFYVRFDTIP